MDFAHKIEAMRELRETTPHPAAVPGQPANLHERRGGHVKRAKELEFPVGPAAKEEKAKAKAKKLSKK